MKQRKNASESDKHERAIEALAAEAEAPVEEVRSVYESELNKVKQGARVQDFVPTLAHRRARQALKRRR